MGIEWVIANHKNKTLFELGKGPWYSIMDPEPDQAVLFLYRDAFVKYFVEATDKHYSEGRKFGDDDRDENLKYYNQLATMLFEFIEGADPEKDLEIADDCGDTICDWRAAGYLFLGSRYTGMPDYNDYLHQRNKQIKADLSGVDFTWPIARLRKLMPFM